MNSNPMLSLGGRTFEELDQMDMQSPLTHMRHMIMMWPHNNGILPPLTLPM